MTRPDRPPYLPQMRRGTGWALVAVVALAVALLIPEKYTRIRAPQEARVLASVPLAGAGLEAGSDAALFDVKRMAPGHRFNRCIVIAADSAGSAVRFAVDGVSGALAPWLRVEGTTGTGTSRDCGDFAADGAAFYTGSLAALGSGGTDGVPTGWVPQRFERRTFRLTVEVADDADAAGAQAFATLVWRLKDPKMAPPTAPVASTPAVSTSPATPRTSGTTPPAPAVPPGDAAVPVACPPTIATRIGDLVAGVARFSWLALLLLLLVLLFLAVQDRIDRRDPKLAQAPMYGRPDQAFPDNGTIPWRHP